MRFAWLARSAAHAASVRIARRCAGINVELHQRHRHAMREERRNTPDRSRLALAVIEREVAFGRGVILEYLRNAEALLELAPDLRAQPVTAGEAQPVLRLLGRWRDC